MYRGLPVTSIAFILPLAFWMQFIIPELAFLVLLHAILLVVGLLFVLDIPIRKPGLRTILLMCLVVSVTVGIIIVYTKFKLPNYSERSNQIMEEIEELIGGNYETEAP